MRRKTYIHERPDWPNFRWNGAALAGQLAAVRHHQGRLLGRVEQLGLSLRRETTLQMLTLDALKTSEIEGEMLEPGQVRSSIAHRLGLSTGGVAFPDVRAEAIANVLLDATQRYAHPLTEDRLFNWHRALFQHESRRRDPITVGAWRTDERGRMEIVSGQPGRETVHFVAPAAEQIPAQMAMFLKWIEDSADTTDLVLKSALAHIWFVTIHPFDDGNGRIGRAIADMLLARSEATGQRCYSMSARLRVERPAYYATLEATQAGDLDLTARLAWFLGILEQALSDADSAIAATLERAQFWDGLAAVALNDRQRAMLHRLLDGFEGKLTVTKWAKMTKVSNDTALRDIDDLLVRQVLVRGASGGRSTYYLLR